MTPSPQRLRIHIVLPFRGITGGNLVLVELARRRWVCSDGTVENWC